MAFQYNLQTNENVNSINMSGTLVDKTEAEGFLKETEALIEAGKATFVLNLQNLEYINSSGLGVFITLLTRARKKGGEVSIHGVSKKVKELFIITKLNTLFDLRD